MVACGKANNAMKTIWSEGRSVVKVAYMCNYYFHVKCVQEYLVFFHVGQKKSTFEYHLM